ncbi:MAG: MoaD/ThiS family protein [Alteripontixanthobacter sp.]
MQLTIMFYGHLGKAIGREVMFDASGAATIGELRSKLGAKWPDHAAELRSDRLKSLIGDRFVDDDTALVGTSSVEFLPPVSGGGA